MNDPCKFPRQQFSTFVANVDPKFMGEEKFVLLAEFDGDVVTVSCLPLPTEPVPAAPAQPRPRGKR